MYERVCSICVHVYDPSEVDIKYGVRPGTRFEGLPEDWGCPICGAYITLFEEK